MSNRSNADQEALRLTGQTKGGPLMATNELSDIELDAEHAKYFAAKRGTLGAVNFALIMGTLVGTAWAILAMVR